MNNNQNNFTYPNPFTTINNPSNTCDTSNPSNTNPSPFGQMNQIPLSNPNAIGGMPTTPTQAFYNPVTGTFEVSFIENILRLNKGKLGTFYFTFTDSSEWRDRVFKGIIEVAGRDHLIISDPKTGKRYLFPLIYFVWAEFDEELEYDYPFR